MDASVCGVARINRRGQRGVLGGHPWIFRADLLEAPNCAAGLVQVLGETGRLLGSAFYSPSSRLSLRMVQRGEVPFTADTLFARLLDALMRRQRLMPGADAYRLVHGEADFLPGIFVDRYNDCLAVHTTCEAADGWIPAIAAQLKELVLPRAIVLRNDLHVRQRDSLPLELRVLHGGSEARAVYREGALRLEVDLLGNPKAIGALDQAVNHVQAAAYAQGETLDCFTQHGGFAMQMALAGLRVTAYDLSASALAVARENATRAGLTHVRFEQGDVLEVLVAHYEQGARFDTIVLDPPPFARGGTPREAAWRAYHELNLRAMKVLNSNSVLVSCSSSARMPSTDFDAILAAAAQAAGRSLHFVQRWSAGPDHPVLAGVPETDYLKCRVLMVV